MCKRSRVIQTMVGEIRLQRPYFYCLRCKKGFYPLDEALGLSDGKAQYDVQLRMGKLANDDEQSYLEELVGGRPFISTSSKFGGLRIRYGRSFSTGMQAIGLHPITLKLLKGYLTTGTQLKLDYPGKGGVVSPVDSIEPPVVMLDDGSVLKLRSEEDIEGRITKILFLGDILISVGDLIENNVEVRSPGYCEEWWAEELQEKLSQSPDLPRDLLELARRALEDPLRWKPSVEEAIRFSSLLKLPLHPEYLPFWCNVSLEELEVVRSWIRRNIKALKIIEKNAVLPYEEDSKRVLTKLLIEHRVSTDGIILPLSWFKAILACLKPFNGRKLEGDNALEAVEKLSGIPQKDKAGSFVGARMGRPEKSKHREMRPPPNVLFPLGEAGGRGRLFKAAVESGGTIEVEVRVVAAREAHAPVLVRQVLPERVLAVRVVGVVSGARRGEHPRGDVVCLRLELPGPAHGPRIDVRRQLVCLDLASNARLLDVSLPMPRRGDPLLRREVAVASGQGTLWVAHGWAGPDGLHVTRWAVTHVGPAIHAGQGGQP